MEKLIDISGYVEKEEDLVKIEAVEGQFYNVLSPAPFRTWRKTGDTEIGSLQKTTDIIAWFANKAELESNVRKPNDKDVYITGPSAPYTRWKAIVRGIDIKWEEDGESDIKVERKFASERMLNMARLVPEGDVYYSVGKTAPFELYGVKPAWECVGAFLSHCGDDFDRYYREGFSIGEIGFGKGLFHLYTEEGWQPMKIIEPFENFQKHIYKDQNSDRLYSIREGFKLGTLEFFTPKES